MPGVPTLLPVTRSLAILSVPELGCVHVLEQTSIPIDEFVEANSSWSSAYRYTTKELVPSVA